MIEEDYVRKVVERQMAEGTATSFPYSSGNVYKIPDPTRDEYLIDGRRLFELEEKEALLKEIGEQLFQLGYRTTPKYDTRSTTITWPEGGDVKK